MPVERSNIQKKVSKIVYKRKRNLAILGILLVLFTGYIIYLNSIDSWEKFVFSRVNAKYDFPEGYQISDIRKWRDNIQNCNN